MDVTHFCDADGFCQEFIPNWQKTPCLRMAKRKHESGNVQFVRAESLRWSFVFIYLVTGRSSGFTPGMPKGFGWTGSLACQATTVLLRSWQMS